MFLFLYLFYNSESGKKNQMIQFIKFKESHKLISGETLHKNEKTKNISTAWKLSTNIAMPSQKKSQTKYLKQRRKSTQYTKKSKIRYLQSQK